MSDFDTRRIGEIAVLEEHIRQLQAQLRASQQASEKWEPKVNASMDTDGGRVTVSFGGKTIAVKLPLANLQAGDATSVTSDTLEVLCKVHIIDQLRPVFQPEIERLVKNASSLRNVGTW